jgi:predicted HTH domain antitoxin
MSEATITVQVPASLLRYGFDQNQVQGRIVEWIVLSLFTEGHISSGKAARLLDKTRIEFLALLRAQGIAYVNYSPDGLEEEFAAVRAMEIEVKE